jgi:hypothetical protein
MAELRKMKNKAVNEITKKAMLTLVSVMELLESEHIEINAEKNGSKYKLLLSKTRTT